MRDYLVKKLWMAVPVIVMVSSLVFFFIHLIPGDPTDFMVGENAALEQKEAFRRLHHLHLPILLNTWPFESRETLRSRLALSGHPDSAGVRAHRALVDRADVLGGSLLELAGQDPDASIRKEASSVLNEARLEWQTAGAPVSLRTTAPTVAVRLKDAVLETQYAWFFRDLLGGRFHSLHSRQSVVSILGREFPRTLELGLSAMLVATLISIPLGTWAAWHQYTWLDNLSMLGAMIGVSMPNFWLGPLLILLFSVELNWFPVSGGQGLRSLVLPALTLGLGMSALLTRMVRASVLEVIHEDYVRTARAKGLGERQVAMRHVLRTALLPIVTVMGLQFGAVLSGSIITEEIFGWPGIGHELISAIRTRDFPLVQGCVLLISVSYVVVNLLTDLLYGRINPRTRLDRE